jgi:hypothetical protein
MTDRPPWWDTEPDALVAVDLPDEQRQLMIQAAIEWGGPTRPTDALARAMGFRDSKAIHHELKRIRTALTDGHPLCKRDWARALVATEFVFASSYYGAAGDWEIVTGWSDQYTLDVLRGLQRSLGGLHAPPRRDDRNDPFADDR